MAYDRNEIKCYVNSKEHLLKWLWVHRISN